MSEVKKKSFDLKLLRRLFSFAGPYRSTLFLTVTLSVLLALVSPVRPYLIQLAVDTYIKGDMFTALLWLTALQFGILIAESLIRFWFLYRINWLGQTVVNDIRRAVFRKVLYQNIAYYDNTPIGTLIVAT